MTRLIRKKSCIIPGIITFRYTVQVANWTWSLYCRTTWKLMADRGGPERQQTHNMSNYAHQTRSSIIDLQRYYGRTSSAGLCPDCRKQGDNRSGVGMGTYSSPCMRRVNFVNFVSERRVRWRAKVLQKVLQFAHMRAKVQKQKGEHVINYNIHERGLDTVQCRERKKNGRR